MTEEFLYYLWSMKLAKTPLFTTEGIGVIIENSGERNFDSGPDFMFAKIRIGDTTWAGNVEMHLLSSDWYRHHHDRDKAYENVILHVVYEHDREVIVGNGRVIPVLVLKDKFDKAVYENYLKLIQSELPIPCGRLVKEVSNLEKMFWLERMMVDRLQEKANLFERDIKNSAGNFQEIFYQKLSRNFGFKTNGDAFEPVARSLPLTILLKPINN